METRQNQRKLRRRQLITSLPVHDLDSGALLGVVHDITTEGLCLRAPDAKEQERCYRLQVGLPEGWPGLNSVVVSARCAWCLASDVPGVFLAGFQFLDILPDGVDAIEQVIIRYGK